MIIICSETVPTHLNNNLCCSQEKDIKQQKCNSAYCQEQTIYSLENQHKYFSITEEATTMPVFYKMQLILEKSENREQSAKICDNELLLCHECR